jgi:5-methylcytosine-specific restriction endonuclease McrA
MNHLDKLKAAAKENIINLKAAAEERIKLEKASFVRGTEQTDGRRKRQPLRKEVKMYVWNRDGGCCVECYSKEKLEYDHIIPHSKGGSDTERNIQLLCEKCNRSKQAKI